MLCYAMRRTRVNIVSHTLCRYFSTMCVILLVSFSLINDRSDSIVPTIATELIVGALLVIMFMLWTTLDLPQRYHGIPKIANYQEYLGVLKEKGYLLSLFQGGNSNI